MEEKEKDIVNEETDREDSTETQFSEEDDNNQDNIISQLDEEKKKSEEYYKTLQRTMAEFDNFRKRTTKEKDYIYQSAVSDTVAELLPVLDNLNRAIETCNEETKVEELLEGVKLVLKQFYDCFKNLGVEEINSVGECFDPELHNAVMHIEDETVDDNTIVEEFQKGYKFKDKVIRHSMVKVAN
jgi:molecular chaperone GrpE